MGLKKLPLMLGLLSVLVLNIPAQAAQGNARFVFNNVLLGGYINNEWVSAYDLQHYPMYSDAKIWGGEQWRIFNANGLLGEGIVCAVQNEHPDNYAAELKKYDNRLPVLDIQTGPAPEEVYHLGSNLLAIDCPWDPVPRLAESNMRPNLSDPTIFISRLAEKHLKGVQPSLSQAFVVDLDGDGKTEEIMLSQNILPRSNKGVNWELNQPLLQGTRVPEKLKAGQYSMILVNWRNAEYPYCSEVACFAAISDGRQDGSIWDYPRVHKIEAFADLNGDGKLEIIVSENSAKGFGYAVIDISEGGFRSLSDVSDHCLLGSAKISGTMIQELMYDGAYGYLIRDDKGLLLPVIMGNGGYAEFADVKPGCRIELEYSMERFANHEEPFAAYIADSGRVLAPAPANWKEQSAKPSSDKTLTLGSGHIRGKLLSFVYWPDCYGYLLQRDDGNMLALSMGNDIIMELGDVQPGAEIELDYEIVQYYNRQEEKYYEPGIFYKENTGRTLRHSPIVLDFDGLVVEDRLTGLLPE